MVKITIRGVGGHGSQPDKVKDPITAAAYVLTGLNAIQSRNVSAFENFTFTICNFTSGSTFNVFPDTAFM